MEGFNLENTVNYRIAMAESLLKRYIFRIIAKDKLKITPEQWAILYFLWGNDGLTVGELAEKSQKDFANTTRIIDKLVAIGYVDKRKNATDSRKCNIYTTPSGKAIKDDVVKCWEKSLIISLKGITKEEQATLIKLLLKVENNALAGLNT
jgi:MarR family transcriptional regulator, organic hydroperoxide resistance regulator